MWPKCGLLCQNNRALTTHRRAAHNVKKFSSITGLACPFCSRNFKIRQSLVRHLECCKAPGAHDARAQEQGTSSAGSAIDLTGEISINRHVIEVESNDGDMQVHTPPELLEQVEEISDTDSEQVRVYRYVQLHPWATPTHLTYSFEPRA